MGGGASFAFPCSAWIAPGKRYSSSFLQGTRPRFASGTLMSLSDDTAFPRWGTVRVRPRFPDAPSGCQPGRSPMRSEERAERPGDGCPCVGAEEICGAPPLLGEGRNEDEHRPSSRATYINEERSVRIPQDTDGAFYLRDQLLSNAEVAHQERVIPRNLTPTGWSMQIPSARGTKSACGRVYAVGVP